MEAAFSYKKWLQFPEAKYRLEEGQQQLAAVRPGDTAEKPAETSSSWQL